MTQITATIEQFSDRTRSSHEFPNPVTTTLSVGESFLLLPRGAGCTLIDTQTGTGYIIQESQSIIAGRLEVADRSRIEFADSSAIDSFSRLRVCNPLTLLDSKQIHDNKPLFWDDQEVSGSGTTSVYDHDTASSTIGVGDTTEGKRVRQTKMRFNYQPGKSFLCIFTGVLGVGAAGITQEIGYFDDNNGMFFRCDGGGLSVVVRTNVPGTPVDTVITQANWNRDKLDGTGSSGIVLDATKAEVFFIDFEWLGVGRVRYGFFIDGVPVYCHSVDNSNVLTTVYTSTPNLPVRYSIDNDGTGAAAELVHLCSTVISEGGSDELGISRYASTGGTHVDANVANTVYALVGIRLKAAHIDAVVVTETMSVLSETNDDFEWIIFLNPTVAGTFTYGDETNSVVQTATGATANTITNGTLIDGGFTNQKVGVTKLIRNALYLGSTIAGVPDEIVLCVRPLSTNADIQGGITWKELS